MSHACYPVSIQYYSQDLRSGEENSSKDGKHVFIHESPALAIQQKKVVPAAGRCGEVAGIYGFRERR